MQPTPIHTIVQSQDLLRSIMARRAAQLEELYPQFKQGFLQLERKLKEHALLLKGKEAASEQLLKNVLEELELKEYRLHYSKPHRSPRHRTPVPPSPKPHQSHRLSETSQTDFHPYHISNFKRSLQTLRIALPSTRPL